MKRTLFAILAMSLALPLSLSAGEREGHGGKIWECTDPSTGTITRELVDFQRAKDRWSLVIDQGSGNTVDEKLEFMMKRLDRFDPMRARHYREQIRQFNSRSAMLNDFELYDLKDSFELGTKSNCKLRVVINQAPEMPVFTFDKKDGRQIRFWVNKELFDQLDIGTKAGLILHEVIYEDAINQGMRTSDASMFLNAVIESSLTETIDLKSWQKILLDAGFYQIVLNKYAQVKEFYPNGSPKSAIFATRTDLVAYTFNGIDFTNVTDTSSYSAYDFKPTLFHENGNPKYARVFKAAKNGLLELDGIKVRIEGNSYFREDGSIESSSLGPIDNKYSKLKNAYNDEFTINGEFSTYENGKFKVVTLVKPYLLNIGGTPVSFYGQLLIDQNKRIISGHISKSVKVINASGKKIKLHKYSVVHLDENGNVDTGVELLPWSYLNSTRFIKVNHINDAVSFEECDLTRNKSECTLIGAKYYDISEIKKRLRVMNLRKNYSGSVVGLAYGGSIAGSFALTGAAIGSFAGPGGALFGVVIGSVAGALIAVPVGSDRVDSAKSSLWLKMEMRKGIKKIVNADELQFIVIGDMDRMIVELTKQLKSL